MSSSFRPLVLLSVFLFVKALFFIWLISQGYIGLGPDEAQYWTWSQTPDWGYYSKPPGIAWQIALTTLFFGNTELGVRFGAVVIGTALPLAVFGLAKTCALNSKTAFWSALVFAFSPLGLMSTLLSITDGGQVLFWTLGCLVIAYALVYQQNPQYYVLGLCILGGALFKWPIYFLWAFVLIIAVYLSCFRTKHLVGGVFFSLLGLLPSLIWNYDHDWVTFKHVAGNVTGMEVAHGGYQGNFLSFIGEQSLLISPIFFILLICAFIYTIRNIRTVPLSLIFCGGSTLVFLLGYSLAALFKKMQGNWCDFIYPTASVFLCWYALEKTRKGEFWIKVGVALSLVLSIFVFSLPYVQSHSLFSNIRIPFSANPFKHNLGGEKLSKVLLDSNYDPNTQFVFSDKYQTTSLLSFYGPQQKRGYFFNVHGIRLNQFSFWPGMPHKEMGKTGYFVVIENAPRMEKKFEESKQNYPKLLQPYFNEVQLVGEFPLYHAYNQTAKAALIYKCVDYNGKEPENPRLY